VSTWREPVTQEFGDGVGDSGVQALRGWWPPGRWPGGGRPGRPVWM